MLNASFYYEKEKSVNILMTGFEFLHEGNTYRVFLKNGLWYTECNGQLTDLTNTDGYDLLTYILKHYTPAQDELLQSSGVCEEPITAERKKTKLEINEYHRRTNRMQELVEEACREFGDEDIPVIYSAWMSYADKEHNLPISNLFDVAFLGEYTVRSCPYAWLGEGGVEFTYGPVVNPTWLDLAVLANASIITTGDRHHCFFEGANLNENGDIVLGFGS